MDTSRSMSATDVKPNRLTAAKAAARTLISAPRRRPRRHRRLHSRGARAERTDRRPRRDRGLARSLQVGGGTAVGDGLVRGLSLVPKQKGTAAQSTRAPAAIVLLTDGTSTEGKVSPLAAARMAKPARSRSTRSRSARRRAASWIRGRARRSPSRRSRLAREDREGRGRQDLHGAGRRPAEVGLRPDRQDGRDAAEEPGSEPAVHRRRWRPRAARIRVLAALVPDLV